MKLKDKIKTALDSLENKEIQISVIEHSADYHAQEFAIWCIENRIEFKDSTVDGDIYSWNKSGNNYTMYQLLQNFKIENDLK